MNSFLMPLAHALLPVAFALHITAGALAAICGIIAISVRKGGRIHRVAGRIFACSMLIMAAFAFWLALAMPDQRVNVFISILASYLVATGWLAVYRGSAATKMAEKVALALAVALCAPFLLLSFELLIGVAPIFRSSVPFKGPVLIAIYAFTAILVSATLGDARVVFGQPALGVRRVSRHLWRMSVGLTLALGSGFTNGLARLLLGPYHVPTAFFLPQLVPLVLLAYWMIRIRIGRVSPPLHRASIDTAAIQAVK